MGRRMEMGVTCLLTDLQHVGRCGTIVDVKRQY